MDGFAEFYPLAGYDSNGVNYVFTFLAATFDPNSQTVIRAQFAYTNDPTGSASVDQPLTSSGLTQYTLTGTSNNQRANFGYLYVQSIGGADVFVTGLDFEPAPAPVTGGGATALGLALGALVAHRLRRREPA